MEKKMQFEKDYKLPALLHYCRRLDPHTYVLLKTAKSIKNHWEYIQKMITYHHSPNYEDNLE